MYNLQRARPNYPLSPYIYLYKYIYLTPGLRSAARREQSRGTGSDSPAPGRNTGTPGGATRTRGGTPGGTARTPGGAARTAGGTAGTPTGAARTPGGTAGTPGRPRPGARRGERQSPAWIAARADRTAAAGAGAVPGGSSHAVKSPQPGSFRAVRPPQMGKGLHKSPAPRSALPEVRSLLIRRMHS